MKVKDSELMEIYKAEYVALERVEPTCEEAGKSQREWEKTEMTQMLELSTIVK